MWLGTGYSSANRDDGSVTSSTVSKVVSALQQTPKGRLVYDRDPKSPPPALPRCDTSASIGANFTSARSPKSPTETVPEDDSLELEDDLPIRVCCEKEAMNHDQKPVSHSPSNKNSAHLGNSPWYPWYGMQRCRYDLRV